MPDGVKMTELSKEAKYSQPTQTQPATIRRWSPPSRFSGYHNFVEARRESEDNEDDLHDVSSEEEQRGEGPTKSTSERLSEKRKMKRFRLNHSQTRFLLNEFALQPHPDATRRARLSREIPGLSPRQVQVWFQNRRAKLKRLPSDEQEQVIQSRALPINFYPSQAMRPSLQESSRGFEYYTSPFLNTRSSTAFPRLSRESPITQAALPSPGAYKVSSKSAPGSTYVSPVSPQSFKGFWSQSSLPHTSATATPTTSSIDQFRTMMRSDSDFAQDFNNSSSSYVDYQTESPGRCRSTSLTSPQQTNSLSIAGLLTNPRQEGHNVAVSESSVLETRGWGQRARGPMPPPNLPIRQMDETRAGSSRSCDQGQPKPHHKPSGVDDGASTRTFTDTRWAPGTLHMYTGGDEDPLPGFHQQAAHFRRREGYLLDDPHDLKGQRSDRFDQSFKHMQTSPSPQ